jgi:hypothetical protein
MLPRRGPVDGPSHRLHRRDACPRRLCPLAVVAVSPMLRSDDPLPQNVIRFSQAFEQFYRTIEPKWQELEAARNDAFSRL